MEVCPEWPLLILEQWECRLRWPVECLRMLLPQEVQCRLVRILLWPELILPCWLQWLAAEHLLVSIRQPQECSVEHLLLTPGLLALVVQPQELPARGWPNRL